MESKNRVCCKEDKDYGYLLKILERVNWRRFEFTEGILYVIDGRVGDMEGLKFLA